MAPLHPLGTALANFQHLCGMRVQRSPLGCHKASIPRDRHRYLGAAGPLLSGGAVRLETLSWSWHTLLPAPPALLGSAGRMLCVLGALHGHFWSLLCLPV